MKNMKVVLAAIAVLSVTTAFSQRASCQAPEVDSTDPSWISGSGTMTIYGSNLSSSDGSCGAVNWWEYTGVLPTRPLPRNRVVCRQLVRSGGTWIDVCYTVNLPVDWEYDDLGTVEVVNDYGDSEGSGPDVEAN
jgi:hypothetical protein